MKLNFKHIAFLFFAILMIVILSSNTTWRVCNVCGTQEYERSLFGKTIELISMREYDEFGTHSKWQEEHGGPHTPHQWVEIKEYPTDLLLEENN